MIIKKDVKPAGNMGKVLVPTELIGKTVYVITDTDISELQELMTMTLLYRKIYSFEQSKLASDVTEFKRDALMRLARLEGIVSGQ